MSGNDGGRQQPPSLYQSAQALVKARDLEPVTELQAELDSDGLEKFKAINCHAHVHNPKNTRESKFGWLLLLNVTTRKNTTKAFTYDGSKKRKLEDKPREYRRLYTFANLASSGATCVMMEMNMTDQMNSFGYVTKCRIGDQFIIFEPQAKVSFMGVNMPILESDDQLFPVRLKANGLPPEVPVPPDLDQLNSSRYFILHNAKIEFDGVILTKTGCTMGNMCDLRNPRAKGCACHTQNSRNRGDPEYVLRGDITIDYVMRNRNEHRKSSLPKVRQWSSQTFSNFVFDGEIPINPLQNESNREITTMLRRKLRRLVTYVNTNKSHNDDSLGWTVIGWYRRSAKNDVSATATADDKVATDMEETTMHIVRIQPTNITKDQLRQARRLVPVAMFGETVDINRIRDANINATRAAQRSQQKSPPNDATEGNEGNKEEETEERGDN